jgi:DMSO/TMAO reductase YedYZ molybdopterin-dependent catalytic subunit
MNRKLFVASSLAALGTGCAPVSYAKDALTNGPFHNVLDSAEGLNHAVIGTRGRARLYTEADIDRVMNRNGNETPSDSVYNTLVRNNWRGYKLVIDGLVDRPQAFTLAELRAMPHLEEITRFDCVEGWSVIGKWRGPLMGHLLAMAQPKLTARYAIFSCYDRDDQSTPFYGSIDLHQAAHPQTILALDFNGAPLDADHGAPARLRIPTQLGYKSTKWINKITLAASFANLYGGKGGYWEDQGYEWFGGI